MNYLASLQLSKVIRSKNSYEAFKNIVLSLLVGVVFGNVLLAIASFLSLANGLVRTGMMLNF